MKTENVRVTFDNQEGKAVIVDITVDHQDEKNAEVKVEVHFEPKMKVAEIDDHFHSKMAMAFVKLLGDMGDDTEYSIKPDER